MTRLQEILSVKWLLELAVTRAERELTLEESRVMRTIQTQLAQIDDGATRQTPALEVVMVVP